MPGWTDKPQRQINTELVKYPYGRADIYSNSFKVSISVRGGRWNEEIFFLSSWPLVEGSSVIGFLYNWARGCLGQSDS